MYNLQFFTQVEKDFYFKEPVMNYCSHCASPLTLKIPAGDNLPRYICENCHTIHYQNPKIVVGCLPFWRDKVLLCRRAIEPRHGFWTLPAGYMENGETVQQGALRETYEEARADVKLRGLFSVFSIPHISQVYMMFLGSLPEPVYAPGPESLEVALFGENEIPWDHLAFPVITLALKYYYADQKNGGPVLHVSDIIP